MAIFAEIFNKFLRELKTYGLEYFGRYYGLYDAQVFDNNDPDYRGRIRVMCPAVFKKNEPVNRWVYPIFPFNTYNPPEIGSTVVIAFTNGDVNFPRYLGGWFTTPAGIQPVLADCKTNPPNVRGFQTRYGHKVMFYDDSAPAGKLEDSKGADTNDDPRVEITTGSGQKVVISDKKDSERIEFTDFNKNSYLSNKDGIIITDVNKNSVKTSKDGAKIEDANGNVLEMTKAGVKVNNHFLVTHDFLDWMVKNQAQFGLGNMGAPVPIFPAAMPDFTAGNQTPDKFKTNKQ